MLVAIPASALSAHDVVDVDTTVCMWGRGFTGHMTVREVRRIAGMIAVDWHDRRCSTLHPDDTIEVVMADLPDGAA